MTLVLGLVPATLFLFGVPVFAVLLAGAVLALLLLTNVSGLAIHQVMFGGVDNYALLSVPFFIFAGDLMARSGIAERLTAWVLSLFGHLRGSLGVAAVGTATVLGAVSGSSPATVAAVGRTLYGGLIDDGYGRRLSAGLITSSGSIAIVVPPSIAMILYGTSAEVSIPKLFLAGILPGLLLASFMALFIVLWARRRAMRPTHGFSISRVLLASRAALAALVLPLGVLSGIYLGWFSPTEAGGFACLYALLLARYGYRSLGWPEILDSASASAYLTAQVLIIVAAAGVFSWILAVLGVPQALLQGIVSLELSPLQFLLIVNLFLLLFGCLLDPTSAILLLTPILIPIIGHFGIDPVHFGVIMTVNLGIGMFTPPFGLNIFMAQSVLPCELGDIYGGLVPFFFAQLLALAAVTLLPELSLALTRGLA